MIINGCG